MLTFFLFSTYDFLLFSRDTVETFFSFRKRFFINSKDFEEVLRKRMDGYNVFTFVQLFPLRTTDVYVIPQDLLVKMSA